ncbi:nucleotidyltransferase family protein [Peribacillus frigoritolerans]|uniref:nucleotidyltransferase domain-containing protein n=1 Tax=Peribacillus frigoritolerans TaxID=450367 RepID=UPI002E23DE10|nr:nucleotidyltransferase family protein [Peribacillus frigoritolerans]
MESNLSLDLSLIPRELRLILEIMKSEKDDSKVLLKNELIKDINWDLFLKLTIHHRVYPFIYSKLNNIDGKSIPSYIVNKLHQEYKKNTFQMLHLSAEMELISKLFTENHIRVLFLKGPVIASYAYGDISLRTSKDLDILIPINKLEKVEELLLNFGYKRDDEATILNELKWRGYHVSYFHPEKNIQLEVHWRLQPRPSKEPSFNELWVNKRVSTISTYPVYFLGKEDLFLYLVSHGARHGWFRLRWLLDIDQILRKESDLDKTKLLLEKYQSCHLGGQAIILASQLLKTPINDEMAKLIAKSRSEKLAQKAILFIKEIAPLHIISSTNYYKCYLFSLKPSYLQMFIYIMLLIYPSSTDANTLRLPKPLHFLYFPLRPFLLVWRKKNKPVYKKSDF